MDTLKETNFNLPYPFERYQGKVRDVYDVGGQLLVFVASDRISAFDCILPRAIPYKGQVLNQMAAWFLKETAHICPNHFVASPDPNVTIGLKCKAYPVEMIVRGYLAGHAWREYSEGKRSVCGVDLPDGLKESDKLPEPVITPSTKSTIGHDIDISEEEIIKSNLVPADEYAVMKSYALELYNFGNKVAADRGLILADTKYEFGKKDDNIYLIDEIHTPDSSRYFYQQGYDERQATGERQKQLSKEFVREWLMSVGFQGQVDKEPPYMPDDVTEEVSKRYIYVYEQLSKKKFEKRDTSKLYEQVETAISDALKALSAD